jgi:hypothetical protein
VPQGISTDGMLLWKGGDRGGRSLIHPCIEQSVSELPVAECKGKGGAVRD